MNADGLARVYRWVEYAAFGRTLERCRFAHLDALAGARRVLILGEGDGRFLARLLAVNGAGRVEVVEVSGEMVRLAKGRVGETERVGWWNAEWPTGSFDAVVTCFFLDCFEGAELEGVVRRAAARLEAGGAWVVGEFFEPEGGWRRVHARVWLWVMYRFFGWTTGLRVRRLGDWAGALRRAGLVSERRKEWRWGLVVGEVWRKRRVL